MFWFKLHIHDTTINDFFVALLPSLQMTLHDLLINIFFFNFFFLTLIFINNKSKKSLVFREDSKELFHIYVKTYVKYLYIQSKHLSFITKQTIYTQKKNCTTHCLKKTI